MLGSDTFSKKGCYINPSLIGHVNRGPFLGGGSQLNSDGRRRGLQTQFLKIMR